MNTRALIALTLAAALATTGCTTLKSATAQCSHADNPGIERQECIDKKMAANKNVALSIVAVPLLIVAVALLAADRSPSRRAKRTTSCTSVGNSAYRTMSCSSK